MGAILAACPITGQLSPLYGDKSPPTPIGRSRDAPRGVIDFAKQGDDAIVKRALRQAKFSAEELALLPPRLRGIRPVPTRSPGEDILYDTIMEAGLEEPRVNAPYRLPNRTVYPDLWWPRCG